MKLFGQQLSFQFLLEKPEEIAGPSIPLHITQSALESDRDLHQLWILIRRSYFPSRRDIDVYSVKWSKRRQKRTLASCNFVEKRVRVALEMRHENVVEFLEPLLYHEMCHAFIGRNVPKRGGKYQWHGDYFKSLEQRHPKMAEFDAWVHGGGWSRAVRSQRSRQAAQERKRSLAALSLHKQSK